jgi:ketosteroid isomerase-like protein
MRRTRSLLAALGSLAVIASCQPAAETAEQAEARIASETAAARTAIEAANAQMAAHMNAERYDSAAMAYAEDARALPPNMVADVGRAAILKSLQGMAGMKGTISFTTTSVAANGPLAVEAGTYSFSFTPPGAPAPVTDTGKYMAHWHKMGDHWMIVENIWNSDLPPMPEPPKKN